MRLAMWSGPRNLSTAMMYAFGARNDCAVWDEPFYAAYLKETGLFHPARQEILETGLTSADDVIKSCLGPTPEDKGIFYLKLMAQHMVPGFDRDWISNCTNVFLIRDPARVIASYAAKRENPTLDDIGFRQQAELFDQLCQYHGDAPPVIDSFDIRANPETSLRNLCALLDLTFQPSMLNWPKGGHKSDGIWADHWYGAVRNSTGFAAAEGPVPEVVNSLMWVWEAALPYYQMMAKYRI